MATAEGTSLVGGSGGILPPPPAQIFKFKGSELLSTCYEICLRKIDLE